VEGFTMEKMMDKIESYLQEVAAVPIMKKTTHSEPIRILTNR
jgi:hypothetical protein